MKEKFEVTITGEVSKKVTIIRKLITLVDGKERVAINTMLDEPLKNYDLINRLHKVLGKLDSGEYEISKSDLDKILS